MKDGRKHGSKDEYLSVAKSQFGISDGDFDRSWSEAVAHTNSDWSKPGRPKSAQ
jgi:hypothetical protein